MFFRGFRGYRKRLILSFTYLPGTRRPGRGLNDKDPPCGGSLNFPDDYSLLAECIGNTEEGSQFVVIVNDGTVLYFIAEKGIAQSAGKHPR